MRSLREAGGRMALIACALLAAPAAAQFDAFEWSAGGNPSGSASVTSSTMHIVGPDGPPFFPAYPVTWMTTVAPQSGTVSAVLDWDNQDMGFGWWAAEAPVYVLNGEWTWLPEGSFEWYDFNDLAVSFHVAAGDSFGFGVWSLDAEFGPGVLDVSDFQFKLDFWTDLGQGLAGTNGVPTLAGSCSTVPGTPLILDLVDAKANAPAWLIVGFSALGAPFKGGVMVPDPAPPALVIPLTVNPLGRITIHDTWPAGIPPGTTLLMQYWIADPAGPEGYAASNGVTVTTL